MGRICRIGRSPPFVRDLSESARRAGKNRTGAAIPADGKGRDATTPGRARRMDILGTLLGRPGKGARPASVRLGLEQLEPRSVPAATASLAGGILTVQGDAARDNIKVVFDQATAQL